MNLDHKEIFQKAWETYGTEAQMRVLMEECAELCDALITGASEEKLFSEIADVAIMLEQMKYIIKDYLSDPDVFERIEANNVDEFDEEFDDPSIEKSISIFLRVIYSINHYNRGKVSSEEICKFISSAELRITCFYANLFDDYSGNTFRIFTEEYARKVNRLAERLGMI